MRSTMKSTAVGSTPIPVKVLSRRANASGSVGPSAHSRFNTSPSLLKTVTPSWRRVRQLTVQCSSTTPSTDSRTVAEVKEALRRELDGPRSRAVINEILLKLEWKNPTPAPTKSEVLTGGWKFAYYGGIAPGLASSPTRPLALALYAGGFSPGAFGLAVADLLPKNVVETQDFTLCIAGIDPFVSTASINVKTLGRYLLRSSCSDVPASGLRSQLDTPA
uniref:Plastid lipid-associated protein/fibrillin conserved domain-containing protein n=1 Tax=Tetraselmis sp. GSL018 TaxID=582737 RepID=A0A061RTB3_9CHLO